MPRTDRGRLLLGLALSLLAGWLMGWSYDLPWHLRSGRDPALAGVSVLADLPVWMHPSVPWNRFLVLVLDRMDVDTLTGALWVYRALSALTVLAAWWVLRRNFPALFLYFVLLFVFLIPRPRVLSYLFLALTAVVFHLARETGRTRWLWLVPGLFWLWGNVHGGFLPALLLLPVFAWDVRRERMAVPGEQLVALGVISALLALLGNVQYGPALVTAYYLPELRSEAIRSYVNEWKPLTGPGMLPLFGLGLLAAPVLRIRPPARKALREFVDLWGFLLSMLALVLLGGYVGRAVPYLAFGLAYLAAHRSDARSVDWGRAFLALVTGVPLFMSLFLARRLLPPERFYPMFLAELSCLPGDVQRLGVGLGEGSLILGFRPEVQVWVDGRNIPPYSPEHLQHTFAALVGEGEDAVAFLADVWTRYLDAAVLWAQPGTLPLRMALQDRGWRVLCEGEMLVVLQRPEHIPRVAEAVPGDWWRPLEARDRVCRR